MSGRILTLSLAMALLAPPTWARQEPPVAIVGATIIDGTDANPIANGSIVIENGKIVAVGAGDAVAIPRNARRIDGRGKYVIPGLIDTNVHVSGFFQSELFALYAYGEEHPYEKYGYSLEGAQEGLKYGVTTMLDTYGPLLPLMQVRDRINRGEAVGPRLLVGGNIIGWGGPASASERGKQPTATETRMNDWFVQGTGVDLSAMYPDDVLKAVNRYMDLGPDFIKIGTTSHDIFPPVTLTFSPRVHESIVAAAHARGLAVEVHSGSVEGHRLAVDTAVDIITHADLVNVEFRPEFAAEICNSNTYFAPFTNLTGTPENQRLVDQLVGADADAIHRQQALTAARAKVDNADRDARDRFPVPSMNKTGAAGHSMVNAVANQKRLLAAGCKIVIGTDSTPMTPPGLGLPGFTPFYSDMGTGTLRAIEGLVGIGMSPREALISATRRGAEAIRRSDQIGTLEAGKAADLVILADDPLRDIANIHKISDVMRGGVIVDRQALPTRPLIYHR